MCLVFMLCISEFVKYCSLLFDTNVSKESIYCDISGKMFNSLKKKYIYIYIYISDARGSTSRLFQTLRYDLSHYMCLK